MNQKILFIRVTENCNAKCFMCNFAGNKNGHMMSISEMFELVKKLEKYNFKLIKFTGGEPLTNPYLKDFIKMLKNKNYYTSIITNGFLLPKKIDELANAGLDQIIVSIDGVDKSSNDVLRGTDGIFDSAIKGIRICKEKYPNIHVRVNTVVSDKNIELLCQLNEMLLLENVDEWSLTPLKEDYNCYSGNEEKYIDIYKKFTEYVENHPTPKLLGYSKYWGGRNKKEIEDLFYRNIHYLPNNQCELVNRVAFYIPSKKLLLPCNSLGHRLYEVNQFLDSEMNMFDKCQMMADWLKKCGQKNCKGCSPINAFLAENPSIIDDDIWSF